MTEANGATAAEDTPRWFKEYSFLEYYNVTSCSPAALQQLVARDFFNDDALSNKVKIKQNMFIFFK